MNSYGCALKSIQLLISLSEAANRDFANDAGLLLLHVPVEDMHPPTEKQTRIIACPRFKRRIPKTWPSAFIAPPAWDMQVSF